MTSKKALFLKWIKNLYYIHCAILAGIIVGALPFIGKGVSWINTILSIGAIYCLYQLMPISERYHKAVLYMGISIVLGLLTKIVDVGLFSFAGSICSLVGLYQEFKGHSELLLMIDGRLSKKWQTLFNWNIFGSIVVVLLGTPVLVAAAIAFLLDEMVISVLTIILVLGYEVILKIFYLRYLKRTHDVCEAYEYWADEVIGGEEI